MKTVMRVLARANGWEMVQDLNSVLAIYHDDKRYDIEDPFQGLSQVTDKAARRLMQTQLYGGH